MIVQFFKELLVSYQNARLNVVANVCDMGTNNVKALNLWGISETEHFSSFYIKKL
jgi:hypothetical protein